jgi:NAD(P)-dependent dehydrogenase (short-subunit alcohol dehydrogenase family)
MATFIEQELLGGRTVLITGGSGGIGYQTARVLAQRGARLVITGREAEAGERVAATSRRESGDGQRSVTFLSPLAGAVTGQYFEAKPTPKRLSARELDPERQQQAWQVGCRLVADAARASTEIGPGRLDG